MGAPTSHILSEIYLQYMELSHLYTILTGNKILGYFCYVDDILIMYNEEDTDIERILNQFNNAMPTMQFSIEKETNNSISFLDITIHKNHDKLSFSVYRKPTTTDTIIPKDSCHPIEHKQAAIRYLVNRMNNYHLDNAAKEQEHGTIRQILGNNKYNPSQIDDKIDKQTERHGTPDPKDNKDSRRWAKLTYVGNETKFITKMFKNLPTKITFTTSNSIGRLLSTKPNHNSNSALDNSGIYRLTCPDCQMKYVGQTGRSFQTRFQEHYRDFRHNNAKSKFATHLLENQHSIGKINNIMEILHITKKGRAMDTIERYHIYKETKNGSQINDKNTVKPNRICETIIQGEANRMRLRNRSNTGQT